MRPHSAVCRHVLGSTAAIRPRAVARSGLPGSRGLRHYLNNKLLKSGATVPTG
jgi:hypothetical protein